MLTTSPVPEAWFKAGQGVAPNGEPFVIVARNEDGVPTTWCIQLTTNRNGKTDWRATWHTDPRGVKVVYPSPRNLSHSPIDTVLRRMAQPGQWVGTNWKAA
jgi:hypothetical protein